MIASIQIGDVRTPVETKSDIKALVVYSDDGTPVAIFLQMPGRSIIQYTANDNNFADALRKLGFDESRIPEVVKKNLDKLLR